MVKVLILPKHDATVTLGTFITCKDYADMVID